MPFLKSPFGPMGLVKTSLMYVGNKILDIHEFLVQKGLSNVLAAGVLTFVGFITFVISIVVVGIFASFKMKQD